MSFFFSPLVVTKVNNQMYPANKAGQFGCISIQNRLVINEEANLCVQKAKVNKELLAKGACTFQQGCTFNEDCTFDGNIRIRGAVIRNSCEPIDVATYDAKRAAFTAMQLAYEANGVVNWSTFSSNQTLHKQKVVTLTTADFANGTLRVQEPCLLRLQESVAFNPNRPQTWLDGGAQVTNDFSQAAAIDPDRVLDWMPDQTNGVNNAQYFQPEVAFAYSLGFFAAIAIECAGVIVDLNGYELSQHQEHLLQQRFFALIELADQPFMPLQGPSNFGAVLRPASNCLIHNGTLGVSSHHGIHGNDCDNIMLENLTIKNFEVAAVALNGCNVGCFKNCHMGPNRQNIPVIGSYSAGRFIKQFVTLMNNMALNTSELDAAAAALYQTMDDTFNAIIFNNGSIPDLFHNVSGLIDGPFYGLLFNVKGVAVNGFLSTRSSPKVGETSDLLLLGCTITGIKGAIREVVALSHPAGGVQVDTAGAVVKFFDDLTTKVGTKYFYQSSPLGDVQIELAKIKQTREDAMQDVSFFGTLLIHKGIQLWQTNAGWYLDEIANNQLQLFDDSDQPVMLDAAPVIYSPVCNGDSMHHVIKGGMGLRVDGVTTMTMKDCGIMNLDNNSIEGSLLCGSYITSHAKQTPQMVGYQGARNYGAIFSACGNVCLTRLNVGNVKSLNGSSVGIVLQNETNGASLCDCNVTTVQSSKAFDPAAPVLPNPPGRAAALRVWNGCTNITVDNLTVLDIEDQTPENNTTLDIRDPITMY